MNLNKITIVGRLAKNIELRKTQSDQYVAGLSVATNESYKNKTGEINTKTEFHNVVVFGSTAENCAKWLTKGQEVLIEGKITTRTWDKQDGTKAYRTEIIASNVQFGTKPSKTTQGDEKTGIDDTSVVSTAKNAVKRNKSETSYVNIPAVEYPTDEIHPDDIPF